jgi:hypothetical protein
MAIHSPYRSLPVERRVELLVHAISASKEARAVYAQRLVSKGGGFRAVTIKTWPAERLAREIVRMRAESADDELDLLQLLFVELEPAIQISFLDAAGVKHDGGKLPDDLPPPFADEAAVRRASAVVKEQYGEDGMRYLRTLARYTGVAWPGIDALVAEEPQP